MLSANLAQRKGSFICFTWDYGFGSFWGQSHNLSVSPSVRMVLARRIAGEIILSGKPGATMRKWRELFAVSQMRLSETSLWAINRKIVLAQATDPKLREKSRGGAVVTSLLTYGIERRVSKQPKAWQGGHCAP
jgi:hypothetical protein